MKPVSLPDWVKDWLATPPVDEALGSLRRTKLWEASEDGREVLGWIRSRPASLHETLIAFPPNCVVVPLRALVVPERAGIVVSYFEPGSSCVPPSVSVCEGPEGDTRGECDLNWIRVIGYWRGITPEKVRGWLKGGTTT